MNNIYPVANQLSNSITDLMCTDRQAIGHLASQTLKIINNLPSQMQNSLKVAFSVIILANAIFAVLGHYFAKLADDYIEKHSKELNSDKKTNKKLPLNIVIFGGTVLMGNGILLDITQYPFSYTTSISITAILMITRLFITGEATFSQKKELDQEGGVLSQGKGSHPLKRTVSELNFDAGGGW